MFFPRVECSHQSLLACKLHGANVAHHPKGMVGYHESNVGDNDAACLHLNILELIGRRGVKQRDKFRIYFTIQMKTTDKEKVYS